MISVGKVAVNLMKADAQVMALSSAQIAAVLVPEKFSGSYVVFHRDKTKAKYMRNEWLNDSSIVVISAYSDSYDGAIDLGEAIRSAIDTKNGLIAGVNVIDIELIDSFDDGEYMQKENVYMCVLVFQIRTQL